MNRILFFKKNICKISTAQLKKEADKHLLILVLGPSRVALQAQ